LYTLAPCECRNLSFNIRQLEIWVYFVALCEGELLVLVHFNKTELEFWFSSKHYVKTELCTTPGGNGERITGRSKSRQCDELRGGHPTVWVQKLENECAVKPEVVDAH